jgi:hypothetical protein
VVVTYNPQATDNCAVTNLTVTPTSGSTFNLGTNTVTAVAYDSSGNTNVCTFKVIVLSPSATPLLSILQSGPNAILSWSNIFSCYVLQYTPELLPTNTWLVHPGPFTPAGGNIYVPNPITEPTVFSGSSAEVAAEVTRRPNSNFWEAALGHGGGARRGCF